MDSTVVEQSVQTAATPFNIFENKGKAESMLNESLTRFKLDSTCFQHILRFQQCWTICVVSVEFMLKQILKPFKRAFKVLL